jgi:hypothetical protein
MAGCALASLWLGPAPLQAQVPPAQTAADDEASKAQAKAEFEKGVAAYDAGHYEDALASFQEAFRIRPHPLVRVNIANCYDKLGRPLEALFHFQQFIDADVGSAEQRKEVQSAVERLRKQVGQVVLRVAPDGATVTIDGGEQRRSPIVDALSLTAGSHQIEVRLEGYQTLTRTIEVKGGTQSELNLVLSRGSEAAPPVATVIPTEPIAPLAAGEQPQVAPPPASPEPVPALPATAEPAPVPATQPEPVAQAAEHGKSPAVWIIGGASVALLLAGSVTGIIALDAESDFDRALRERLDPNSDPLARQAAYERALDASDRADALALTTDILLLGALGGATVTAILLIKDSGEESSPEGSASLVPVIAPHAVGARLRYGF